MAILVFAGAGASAAIDPKQYPTTAEFFKRLPDSVTRDNLLNEVKAFFESGNTNLIDIEHILGALGEISNYLWTTHDTSDIIGWMASRNTFTVINQKCDITNFYKHSNNARNNCFNLISSIHELFYRFYGEKPNSKNLNLWIHLLKEIEKIDPIVEIFTTNYDIVLECAIEEGKINIGTGRVFDGLHTSLNTMLWGDPDPELRRGRLTKLHGSVDWQSDFGTGPKPIYTSSIFTGDLQRQLILYPGTTKEKPEWPYDIFYKDFEKSVAEASALVFIGYSFRDVHINNILQENMSDNVKRYIITKSNQYPDLDDLDFMTAGNNAKHNDKGFTSASAKDCLDHLSS